MWGRFWLKFNGEAFPAGARPLEIRQARHQAPMKTIVIVETYIRALIGCPLWHIAVHIKNKRCNADIKSHFTKNDFGDPLKLIVVNSKNSLKVLGISL